MDWNLQRDANLSVPWLKREKNRFRFIVAMEYNLWKDVDIELYSSGGDEAVKVMRNSFALSTLMNFACRVLNPSWNLCNAYRWFTFLPQIGVAFILC